MVRPFETRFAGFSDHPILLCPLWFKLFPGFTTEDTENHSAAEPQPKQTHHGGTETRRHGEEQEQGEEIKSKNSRGHGESQRESPEHDCGARGILRQDPVGTLARTLKGCGGALRDFVCFGTPVFRVAREASADPGGQNNAPASSISVKHLGHLQAKFGASWENSYSGLRTLGHRFGYVGHVADRIVQLNP